MAIDSRKREPFWRIFVMCAVKNIKRVVFVQKFIPMYRLPLFEALRKKLQSQDIEFVLIYGDPDPYYGSKIRMSNPDWGVKVQNRIFPIIGKYIYWQGAAFKVRKGDIVICEHAARLLDNYPLFIAQQFNFLKMCYFGHGVNFQHESELWISAKIKQLIVKRVAKWFAYTQISADALERQGVPQSRISIVNNTLTNTLELTESEVSRSATDFVYIGGLYNDKRIDFLLESCSIVKQRCPSFKLHIVGSGPEEPKVSTFANGCDWCEYHGSLYGTERERLLFSCSAILMPGAVGLVAIDSFHFATPLISTANGQHGPEIAYLSHEENYLTLPGPGTPESYAELVERYFMDHGLSGRLRDNCRGSADVYTIDETANRFVEGILTL